MGPRTHSALTDSLGDVRRLPISVFPVPYPVGAAMPVPPDVVVLGLVDLTRRSVSESVVRLTAAAASLS